MDVERRIGERLNNLVQRQEKINARWDEMFKAVTSIKDRLQGSGGATAMVDVESNRESLVEEDDLLVQLRNLKQVSHIRSYIKAFEELNSRAGIEEDQALSIFLSGLLDEIRVPVCMFEPKTLDDAYALSKLQELTITGALWCDRKKRYEDEVDYSMKDSIRNPALKTEWKLDSEMEDETYADEEIDLDVEIDVIEEEETEEDLMEQHSSERYEEMDIDLKIGVEDCTRVSKEIEDIEFLEVVVTPLQKTREMEIFMPMGKSTEVKKRKELEQDTLKGTECISHARQNAQVNELTMVLPIATYYSLSLPWLLNWFPRPTVKLKFMAQRDEELYEEWGSHESHEEGKLQPISSITDLQSYKLSSYQKSTSYLAVEISDAKLKRIVVPPRFIGKESDHVLLEFSDSKQLKKSESLPTARPNALVGALDVISPISAYYCVSLWMFIWYPKPMVKMKREEVVLEVWSHDSLMARNNIKLSPTTSGHLVKQASKQFGKVEEMASSSIYRSLKRLSVRFPRPMVKMKLTKYVGRS